MATLGIVVGNTTGPLAGAWLLRRNLGFRPSLTRLQDVLTMLSIMLSLATDGAEETTTEDGCQFGTDRVIEYLRAHRQDSARRIAEGIYRTTRTFAKDEPQDDDIALVVVKVEELVPGMRLN